MEGETYRCRRCEKEKESHYFLKNLKYCQKILKHCSDCREYIQKIREKRSEIHKESHKRWREENEKTIRLYSKHYKNIEKGIPSDWEDIKEINNIENRIIGYPSEHRKDHEIDLNHNIQKECSECFISKDLNEFNQSKRNWDKKKSICKECFHKYRERNKERIKEYNRQYWLRKKKLKEQKTIETELAN